MSEIWKQWYLYNYVLNGTYDVWYFPFQLCSIPMYLCIAQYFLCERQRNLIDDYLQDFSMLGGIAALIVPDGFIHPSHLMLTLHGYLWHILLIIISLECARYRYVQMFHVKLKIFLPLAAVAELINICLHPYGDCDMFYISPYHLSSQPIFRDIDMMVGRPIGIIIYLIAVIFGAWIIHKLYDFILFHRPPITQ